MCYHEQTFGQRYCHSFRLYPTGRDESLDQIRPTINVDFLYPVYRTNCLRTNKNKYHRLSILHNLTFAKKIKMDDVFLIKNIFLVETELNNDRKEKEKLKNYISRRCFKNKEFENISIELYNLLIEKTNIISHIHDMKKKCHYRNSDHPVLISATIGNASICLNETMVYEFEYDIESIRSYGIIYTTVNQSKKSIISSILFLSR